MRNYFNDLLGRPTFSLSGMPKLAQAIYHGFVKEANPIIAGAAKVIPKIKLRSVSRPSYSPQAPMSPNVNIPGVQFPTRSYDVRMSSVAPWYSFRTSSLISRSGVKIKQKPSTPASGTKKFRATIPYAQQAARIRPLPVPHPLPGIAPIPVPHHVPGIAPIPVPHHVPGVAPIQPVVQSTPVAPAAPIQPVVQSTPVATATIPTVIQPAQTAAAAATNTSTPAAVQNPSTFRRFLGRAALGTGVGLGGLAAAHHIGEKSYYNSKQNTQY